MSITLNFAGDVVLADLIEKFEKGLGTRLKRENLNPFLSCQPYLERADLNIINLEAVLSDTTERKFPWSEIMRGDPAYVQILKENRINAVNLANNHSLDHGTGAFNELRKTLDDAGIINFGGPRDNFQDEPVIINIKSITIALFGFYIEESLLHSERDELLGKIKGVIKTSRAKTEIIIVSLHWGSEYTDRPYSWMIKHGTELIDSGADIIYGHHGHTFQGIASYKNGIFAPCMGNFVFEDIFLKNRISGILTVDYNMGNISFRVIPLIIDKKGCPDPDVRSEHRIALLNRRLQEVVTNNSNELSAWDFNARKQVRTGHLRNRIKIRLEMLKYPFRYLPFFMAR